jgi:hypothetical protein
MTVHLLKSTFSRGELSKKAYSRVDLELYAGGAALCRNFVNLIHGGLRRRSGTRFAGEVKYHDKKVRFIPFVFNSTGQSYVLEFGHLYVRFWSDYGQVISGGSPVEVTTPYTEDDVAGLHFAQTGDTLFLAHKNFAPRRLVRSSHTAWAISTVPFVDGPYMPLNDTQATLTSSGDLVVGDTTTITLSDATAVNGGAGFQSTDVGRWIRMRGVSKWVSGVIATRSSTTSITVTWKRVGAGTTSGDDTNTGGAGSATRSWRLGSFSDTTGYPGCVAFYEGRLSWARTDSEPRTVFFSRSGLPFDYAPSHGDSTVTADLGFSVSILAGLTDELLWLVEAAKLQIGTAAGIRTIAASDSSQALSSTNISQKLEVRAGASRTLPTNAQDVTIYPERFGKALRNLYFSFEQNSLIAPTFSELSDHLFLDGVEEVTFQQVPEAIIWARTSTGKLRGVTYNREEKVIGFHQHDIAGGKVRAQAVIPGSTRDELWLCVERTINGSVVKYVEVLEKPFEDDAAEDAFFVDCGLTYEGAPASTISGLDHLEGETVAILADGAVLPKVTVTGGSILLPNGVFASKVHVGLPMVAEAELLRSPYQQQDGVILGRKQRVVKAHVEVIRSGGVKVGVRGRSTEEIRFRKSSDLMGQPVPLADGTYNRPLEDSWDSGGQVYIRAEDPLPALIRSVLVTLDTEVTN